MSRLVTKMSTTYGATTPLAALTDPLLSVRHCDVFGVQPGANIARFFLPSAVSSSEEMPLSLMKI